MSGVNRRPEFQPSTKVVKIFVYHVSVTSHTAKMGSQKSTNLVMSCPRESRILRPEKEQFEV